MTQSLRPPIIVACDIKCLSTHDVIAKLPLQAQIALGLKPDTLPDNVEQCSVYPKMKNGLSLAALSLIENGVERCLHRYRPRGVYKIFNPVCCTLPPTYIEPAIKIIGTMMILKGQDAYNYLSKAQRCAIIAATIEPVSSLGEFRPKNSVERSIDKACALALLEKCTNQTNAAVVSVGNAGGLYTCEPLYPGEGDFSLAARPYLVFYSQAEKLLHFRLNKKGNFVPPYSTVAVSALLNRSQVNHQRSCGRCKYRSFCSIRAIGMNCHGKKGTFAP